MSQSLYTAMSGITAATTSLQVIANNIANINTTAYKSSSVEFSDVFYQTVSSGSVATDSTGGTNPVQVGVGTQVAAVSKNFSTGSWMATGNDTDLMIQGSGFFCVQSSDGSTFYTRDGSFSFDSDGNLVTSDGNKVLGTDSILSSNTSGHTVQVPLTICADVSGTDSITLGNQTLSDLNNLSKNITTGDFNIVVTAGGVNYSGTVTALELINTDTTVSEMTSLLETGSGSLRGVNFTDAAGNTISGLEVNIVNGQVQFDTSNAIVTTSGGNVSAVTGLAFNTTGLTDATNFLTATGLSTATNTMNPNATCITNGSFEIDVTTAAGTYTAQLTIAGIGGTTTAAEAAAIINAQLGTVTTAAGDVITGITATVNSSGALIINASTAEVAPNGGGPDEPVTAIAFDEGAAAPSSNLALKTTVGATGLTATTSIADTYYATDTLDYTVVISELTSASESISATNQTINADGSIQVTYDDGSVLSVQLSADGSTYEFIYTTSDHVPISGTKCTVDDNVAAESNFVIQLATITNTDGLISSGSNLYKAGPNSGDIIYTVGSHMGAGSLQSGGLEASNVDLSDELSDMILAQRAIEANSRVFTTTSDVMSTVVQMGR